MSNDIKYNDFRTLKVYQKSIEITKTIIDLTKTFPAEEKYRLTDQLNRAVTSIGANIAEGVNSGYNSKIIHFCYIALGSSNEVIHWIKIAELNQYISPTIYDDLVSNVEEIIRMLLGYMRSIRNKKE